MNIEIQSLKSGLTNKISINQELKVDKDLLKTTDLLDLKDVVVTGDISLSYNDYNLSLKVTGEMVLPCSLTLKPVNNPFIISIEGEYQELMADFGENTRKSENTLDIFPIIWENILVEIPMRVVSEDAETLKKGNGWNFIDDEKINNSPFEKLNELLDRKEV